LLTFRNIANWKAEAGSEMYRTTPVAAYVYAIAESYTLERFPRLDLRKAVNQPNMTDDEKSMYGLHVQ
jgi:hypothetical protein